MKQKFKKNTFIRVVDKMPESMSHFASNFIGIVEGSYSQLYGGNQTDKYSLYVIKGGKVVNNVSWYYENQLEAMEEQDYDKAEEMIENYNLRNERD